MSADDSARPVLGFSASGELPDCDDGNPFWALVGGDVDVSRGTRHRRGRRRRFEFADRNVPKTSRLRSASATTLSAASARSVDDIRVAPLVKSKWNQGKVGSKKVYNYHVPSEYLCGCVATAMAQIMRYHKFPSSVSPQSFTCYLGSGQTATTITTSASRSPTGINWKTGGCSIPSGGLYVGNRWGNNIVIGNANGTKASILALSSLSLSLSGTAGSWYNVERTYELNNPRWETVESFMIPSAGSKSVSLPVEYGVNSAFYRVVPKTAP